MIETVFAIDVQIEMVIAKLILVVMVIAIDTVGDGKILPLMVIAIDTGRDGDCH